MRCFTSALAGPKPWVAPGRWPGSFPLIGRWWGRPRRRASAAPPRLRHAPLDCEQFERIEVPNDVLGMASAGLIGTPLAEAALRLASPVEVALYGWPDNGAPLA